MRQTFCEHGRVMDRDARPPWNHWLLTALCAAWLLGLAIPMVIYGADSSSRFLELDDPIVRILGVVLFAAAPALMFRWNWAFWVASVTLVLMAVETLVTYDPGASSVPATFMVGFVGIAILLPVFLLSWLRGRMVPGIAGAIR